MEQTPWNDLRDAVDAMASAIAACADGEWSHEDMWLELDAQCQNLAHLATRTADDDEDEEEDDGVKEINFDDEDSEHALGDFEDDEDLN